MLEVKLEDFLKIDFLGGTLVEYKYNHGFDVEFSREKINKINISEENYLRIETNNKVELNLKLIELYISKKDRVYYLDIKYLYCYSIAQKGIIIPKKIDYEDLISIRNN